LQIGVQTFQDDPVTGGHAPRDIVRCKVDISQGTVTMPASLLSQLSTTGPRPATVFAEASKSEILHHVGKSRVTFIVDVWLRCGPEIELRRDLFAIKPGFP
jgi:hypothetical protein